MEMSLHPDIEQIIRRHTQSGKYFDAADVIRSAVLMLDEKERLSPPHQNVEAAESLRGRSLRGLLADIASHIDLEDIQEARREMWSSLSHGRD